MPAEPQPVFNDDGSLSGYTLPLEDGSVAVYGADGDLLGAAAVGGDWYDAEELEADDQGDPYADGYGEEYAEPDAFEHLDERLSDLEQRATEPAGFVPMYGDPPLSQDQVSADIGQQAAHLEARLGRSLTLSEKRAIGGMLTEAAVAGERRPDLQGAVDQLAAEGRGLRDLDHGSDHQRRAARQAHMSELMADRDRTEAAERGEDDLTSEERPASQAVYNLDDRAERAAYLEDRLRGATDSSAAYSGSDLETESQEGSP